MTEKALPIWSIKYLGDVLDVPPSLLESLANSAGGYYRSERLTSTSGKVRILDKPKEPLKFVQKRIYRRVLASLELPPHIVGAVPGRSLLDNTVPHTNQPWIVKLDLQNFFPSVRDTWVYEIWAQLGCSRQVASVLTRLTTFRHRLPQGTSTSPALANLALLPVDMAILTIVSGSSCAYTRWIDDLTISGTQPHLLVPRVARAIQKAGFSISRRKLKLQPRSSRQYVTGLTLNSGTPCVSQAERARLRAAIHRFAVSGHLAATAGHRRSSLEGSVLHVERFNPESAERLRRQLEATS